MVYSCSLHNPVGKNRVALPAPDQSQVWDKLLPSGLASRATQQTMHRSMDTSARMSVSPVTSCDGVTKNSVHGVAVHDVATLVWLFEFHNHTAAHKATDPSTRALRANFRLFLELHAWRETCRARLDKAQIRSSGRAQLHRHRGRPGQTRKEHKGRVMAWPSLTNHQWGSSHPFCPKHPRTFKRSVMLVRSVHHVHSTHRRCDRPTYPVIQLIVLRWRSLNREEGKLCCSRRSVCHARSKRMRQHSAEEMSRSGAVCAIHSARCILVIWVEFGTPHVTAFWTFFFLLEKKSVVAFWFVIACPSMAPDETSGRLCQPACPRRYRRVHLDERRRAGVCSEIAHMSSCRSADFRRKPRRCSYGGGSSFLFAACTICLLAVSPQVSRWEEWMSMTILVG